MIFLELLSIYLLSGLISIPIVVKLIRFVNFHFGSSGGINENK